MSDTDGNGHNDNFFGGQAPPEYKEMEDLTVAGFKALYPDMMQQPLFTSTGDSNNPGLKLISNDGGGLLGMLKMVWLVDIPMAEAFAAALCECSMFLFDDEDEDDDLDDLYPEYSVDGEPVNVGKVIPKRSGPPKPNPEVMQRVSWIQNRLALLCSVGGRFADKYTQAATGVLTNSFQDGKGWFGIMPVGRSRLYEQGEGGEGTNGNGKGKRGR